ncbi:MAG TPA: reverse transcriptase domain-containing protein [Candidatus Methylomirabilis sp.]|nr:reverse transcriptase domain-containing protein [Candidatus Methylomirabilis sp.]
MKKHHGSAGIEAVPLEKFALRQAYSLALVQRKLHDGTYQPHAVKRVEIAKTDGGVRKLGMPTERDRVVQQALGQRMEPIFAPPCLDCSFGSRKGRSPHEAMRTVWRELQAGDQWIVDAALRASCDTIDQTKRVDVIAEEISDGRVLTLGWSMLRAGVLVEGHGQPTRTGVPQGGVASPLWSHISLPPFDRYMTEAGYRLTRWAEDFVIVGKTRQEAERALAKATRFLQDVLSVEGHPQKTRLVHITHGVEFLGDPGKRGRGERLPAAKRQSRANSQHLSAVPRQHSVQRFQEQRRALTRRKAPLACQERIKQINPVIRGWGLCSRTAPVRLLLNRLDRWIERRLYSCWAKRGRNGKWRPSPASRRIGEFGLGRLTHLIPGLVAR